MTCLEIIEWIQGFVERITMQMNEQYEVSYFDDYGKDPLWFGKDLISIVLEINNRELIK